MTDNVAEGRAAWERLRRVGTTSWQDWTLVARALAVGREQAMKTAKSNRPYGPAYTRAMRQWIDDNGFSAIPQTERYACHRLLENLPAITAWRDSLPPKQRLKNNHPHGVFWAWRRSLNLAPPLKKLPSAKMPPKPAKGANVYWPQDAIRRAALAMKEHRSNDWLILARAALEAAIRDTTDLDTLSTSSISQPAPSRPAEAAALVPA